MPNSVHTPSCYATPGWGESSVILAPRPRKLQLQMDAKAALIGNISFLTTKHDDHNYGAPAVYSGTVLDVEGRYGSFSPGGCPPLECGLHQDKEPSVCLSVCLSHPPLFPSSPPTWAFAGRSRTLLSRVQEACDVKVRKQVSSHEGLGLGFPNCKSKGPGFIEVPKTTSHE